MLRSLSPLVGCGLMLLVCVAFMAFSGRRRQGPPPVDDVAALRAEVERLRRLDGEPPVPAEDSAP